MNTGYFFLLFLGRGINEKVKNINTKGNTKTMNLVICLTTSEQHRICARSVRKSPLRDTLCVVNNNKQH